MSIDYYKQTRSEMGQFLPETYSTVLEVGCGSGTFIQHLNTSAEVWGIEPNVDVAKEAEAKGYKILTGFYDEVEAQLPGQYFDVIICNDVIEHMPDHDDFLEKIKSKLSPNGCLVGSIPNIRHLIPLFEIMIKKDFEYQSSGIFDRTHLRFFTQKSLLRTFNSHQYQVNKFSGIHGSLKVPTSMDLLIKDILTLAIILITFGYYYDAQYRQYGFNVTVKN